MARFIGRTRRPSSCHAIAGVVWFHGYNDMGNSQEQYAKDLVWLIAKTLLFMKENQARDGISDRGSKIKISD